MSDWARKKLRPQVVVPWPIRRIKPVRFQCFRNACLFVAKNPEWTLVHGVVINTGTHAGKLMVHAWAEREGVVYDPSFDRVAPVESYYLSGQVLKTYRYPSEALLRIATDKNHYGPWEEDLLSIPGWGE